MEGRPSSPLATKLLVDLKRGHTGQARAISSRKLEARYSVAGSTLRLAVLRLRRAGEPICSGQRGYYYAETPAEVWDTVGHMEGRMAGSARVVKGLRRSANNLPGSGQIRLPDENEPR